VRHSRIISNSFSLRLLLNLFENGDNLGYTDFDFHGAFPFFDGFFVEITFKGKALFFATFFRALRIYTKNFTCL